MPSRVVQERRPPRLEIGQRLPLEDVSQLVAGFSDKGRPEANRMDTVLFPDGGSWSLNRACSFAIWPGRA